MTFKSDRHRERQIFVSTAEQIYRGDAFGFVFHSLEGSARVMELRSSHLHAAQFAGVFVPRTLAGSARGASACDGIANPIEPSGDILADVIEIFVCNRIVGAG